LNGCTHPLDPLDIEALAAGGEPPVRPDAAAHAFVCPACAESVRRSRSLDDLVASEVLPAPPPDLADRVLRIRPFSAPERRSLAVWQAPLLLLAGLTAGGLGLIAGPGVTAREQVGLAAALFGSAAGLARAGFRWAQELSRSAPAALDALSQLTPGTLGWAALLLLLPAGFGLRAVLVRALSRR
jgi:hypothetical protein